jgi:hypothetical protein
MTQSDLQHPAALALVNALGKAMAHEGANIATLVEVAEREGSLLPFQSNHLPGSKIGSILESSKITPAGPLQAVMCEIMPAPLKGKIGPAAEIDAFLAREWLPSQRLALVHDQTKSWVVSINESGGIGVLSIKPEHDLSSHEFRRKE